MSKSKEKLPKADKPKNQRKTKYKTVLVETRPLKLFNVGINLGGNIEKFIVTAHDFQWKDKSVYFFRTEGVSREFVASFINVVYIVLTDEKIFDPKPLPEGFGKVNGEAF